MAAPKQNNLVLLLAAAAFCMSSSYAQPPETQTRESHDLPTVVRVNKIRRGVEYQVDSKPTSDLLYALNAVHDKRGSDTPIIVLLDPGVPIDQIWNVDGTAGKAQLDNLRFFVFNLDTRKMTEIKWGNTFPYSTNPPTH
jgi:hypothetical protein